MNVYRLSCLLAFILASAASGIAADQDEWRQTMGADCGGDDARSRAICDCVFDQMEQHLTQEQLEEMAARQRHNDEADDTSPGDRQEMNDLMQIAAQIQEIDFMQCAGAAPR